MRFKANRIGYYDGTFVIYEDDIDVMRENEKAGKTRAYSGSRSHN